MLEVCPVSRWDKQIKKNVIIQLLFKKHSRNILFKAYKKIEIKIFSTVNCLRLLFLA